MLELPLNLDRTALKAVALSLNGGHVGTEASLQNISIIVKNGETFTAPAAEGLTRPDDNTDSYFKWLGSDGKLYAPGESAPASVTSLAAQWTAPVVPVTPVEEPAMPWWAILPALDETQGFSFADVDRGDWFYNDVYSVYEAGLMTGTGADTFSPYGGATRGMIVTVLARMSGVSTSGSPWYAAGQRWAMTNGVSDGTDMTGTITREQLAAMLYRYAQLCGADVSVGADTNILRYADAAELSGYAVPAMQWACGVGLVQGSGGKLSPKATANRAQAAAMLMRFCTVVR